MLEQIAHLAHRYTKYVPQLWGVQIPKLLGIVIGTGFLIGIGQVSVSTNTGKIIAFAVGAVAAGAGYFACLMQEKLAEIANKDDFSHVLETLTNQCGANNFVRVLPTRQKPAKKNRRIIISIRLNKHKKGKR